METNFKVSHHIPFCHQNKSLVRFFFLLRAQENKVHSRVPVTRLLLFSKLLRNVPEMNATSIL
jgi:hypothetical protein